MMAKATSTQRIAKRITPALREREVTLTFETDAPARSPAPGANFEVIRGLRRPKPISAGK